MKWLSIAIVGLGLVCACEPNRTLAGDVSLSDVYQVDQTYQYEVAVPKSSFIGSPFLLGKPGFGVATKEEDFEKFFIRVHVEDLRTSDVRKRAVLRVDMMDREDKQYTDSGKGLYWAYVDASSQGTRILGRDKDDTGEMDDTSRTIKSGLRFPFLCARPPAFGFKNGKVDGYVESGEQGVMYVRASEQTDASPLRIETTCFVFRGVSEENAGPPVRWMDSQIANLVKPDSGAIVLYREKQEWDKADDWMWRKMERVDKDGTILMRCVRTK